MRQIIADTGPIVALLNARDEHHDWARETMEQLEAPLTTCEPVLAEASYLVRNLTGGPEAILDLVTRGVLKVGLRVDGELFALRTMLTRYRSVPMSLADACLVRLSEMNARAEVLTLDRDFLVYRRSGRLRIPLIAPFV